MTQEIILTSDQQYIHDSVIKQVNMHVGRFDCNIQGPAGTGKSTLIAQIIKNLSFGFTVGITSPTHKANRVLSTMLRNEGVAMGNCDIMTIHSFLGLKLVWKKDKQVLEIDKKSPNAKKRVDVLVVDECSMISHDMYMHIVAASHRVRRAIIFLGDACQLPPVEPEKTETVVSVTFGHGAPYKLDKVLRQALDNPIIKLATSIRECIGCNTDPMQFLTSLDSSDENNTVIPVSDDLFFETFFETIKTDRIDELMEHVQDHKILAYTNKKVEEWNEVMRLSLFPEQEEEFFYGEPIIIDGPGAKCPYSVQELIQCPTLTKTCWFGIDCWEAAGPDGMFLLVGPQSIKEYNLKLQEIIYNINTGVVNKLTKKPYGWADYYVIKERISSAVYPYASTLHKSQGSTYQNIWLDVSSVPYRMHTDDKARALYTAVTRPRQNIIIAR